MLVHLSAALIGPDPDFNVKVSPWFVLVLHLTKTSALQISRKQVLVGGLTHTFAYWVGAQQGAISQKWHALTQTLCSRLQRSAKL
jgi:hypothetical protein